jgi:hypothetical protein
MRFDEVVKGFDFIKNVEEPCVYKKVSGGTIVFLVLYVHVILLIRNDISTLEVVKSPLERVSLIEKEFLNERFRRSGVYFGHKDL